MRPFHQFARFYKSTEINETNPVGKIQPGAAGKRQNATEIIMPQVSAAERLHIQEMRPDRS